MPFSEEKQLDVHERFINRQRAHGLNEQFLSKQQSDNSVITKARYYSFSSNPQVVLIDSIFLKRASTVYRLVQSLSTWFRNDKTTHTFGSGIHLTSVNADQSRNRPFALRKYQKQLNLLVVEMIISIVSFMMTEVKKFGALKTFWRKNVFYFHNPRTAGQFRVAKAIDEFLKTFCFLNCTEFFIFSNKNCPTCPELKQVPSKSLKTPFQPVSLTTSHLKKKLFGTIKSPTHR